MSINTGNLVTTTNGQEALANVHNINARLHADHREISIKLLFPYMAISTKSTSDIDDITASTDEEIRAEASWTHVDICQVHSYSVENDTKRDFAIGGLFNVEQTIEGARTIILFCKTQIVDARSASKKLADGNRSAQDIVENDYGYTVVQLPFAYTQVLDSAGDYQEGGITIGASKYGRSRHRFYFNYIIDNNSGIADNITVDDNVYPYSDGYLSKTAFELGLKRYEEAVAQYQAEYEKYANGHKLYYDTLSDAIKWASPQHKFMLVTNEAENADLPTINIQDQNAYWNVTSWPESSLTPGTTDSYDSYTPAQYGPDYGNDNDRALYDRAMKFEYRDVREVEFTNTGEKQNIPVYFQFMFYIRTSLPVSHKSSYVSVYHVLRFTMQYEIEGQPMLAIGEIAYKDDSVGFVPSCPSVGKIYINGTMPSFSLLTEEVLMTQPSTDIRLKAETCAQLHYLEPVEAEGIGYKFSDNQIKNFKSGKSMSVTTGNVYSGLLTIMIQPNYASGYTFCDEDGNVYCLGKDFDMKPYVNSALRSSVYYPTLAGAGILWNHIMSDIPVMTSGGVYGGEQFAFKDSRITSHEDYNLNATSISGYRLIGDFRLHNARVFVYDNGAGETEGDNIDIKPSTEILIKLFIGNKYLTKTTTYGQLVPQFSESEISSISQIEITAINDFTDASTFEKITYNCTVRYKRDGENSWVELKVSTLTNTQFISKYIAIEDYEGTRNAIRTCE